MPFNIAKRPEQWNTYRENLTCYNKEIRKAKRSSWRKYCQISDVSDGASLMKIMKEQATNKDSTIKLPNFRFSKTETDTLKELFRVHFPDSNLIDDSYDDRQGQLNLDICGRITNKRRVEPGQAFD
jgi:hypothetical protein